MVKVNPSRVPVMFSICAATPRKSAAPETEVVLVTYPGREEVTVAIALSPLARPTTRKFPPPSSMTAPAVVVTA